MDKNIGLQSIVGGALQEKFERAFGKVVMNLQDPNTPYKTKREIDIKLKFEQNEARDDVAVDIEVKEKLAPQSPLTTKFAVGTDLKTGEVITEEYGNREIKGQISVEDYNNNVVDLKGVK